MLKAVRQFNANGVCARIGKCLAFGCDETQTRHAVALVRRAVEEENQIRIRLERRIPVDAAQIYRKKVVVDTEGPFEHMAISRTYENIALDMTQATLQHMLGLAYSGEAVPPKYQFIIKSMHGSTYKRARATDIISAALWIRPSARTPDVGKPAPWIRRTASGPLSGKPDTEDTDKVTEITTHIRSNITGETVGYYTVKIKNNMTPQMWDALELMIPKANITDQAARNEILSEVRALEDATWRRPDAVEDLGGQ